MDLLNVAKRVKAGVALLNRKIPNWRTVLRRHADQFEFEDGNHCVLGTLEHFSGRMAVLKKRAGIDQKRLPRYRAARIALGLSPRADETYGFEAARKSAEFDRECEALSALWRAEFEK